MDYNDYQKVDIRWLSGAIIYIFARFQQTAFKIYIFTNFKALPY